MAVLLATPEIGIDTFLMTGKFMGWPFAFLRLGAALIIAIIAAVAVARASSADSSGPVGPAAVSGPFVDEGQEPVPALTRAARGVDELVEHILPWTVLGLVMAGLVAVAIPEGRLDGLGFFGLDVLVVSVVAIPTYVCAVSATPLAAVLIAKGISPGAVLAGLLLGAGSNVATLGFMRRSFGARATMVGVIALVLSLRPL